MPDTVMNVTVLVAAFLLGTVAWPYLLARLARGLDLRREGSGNVGGMNALRVAGPAAGVAAILLDAGKGALAVWLAARWGSDPLVPMAAALLVVLGHNFNPFLGFRGGKGLAAALGVFLVFSPWTVPAVLGVMVLLALLFRDANTGAGAGILALPPVLWALHGAAAWPVFGAAMALLIAVKHIPDLRAYRAGRRKLF